MAGTKAKPSTTLQAARRRANEYKNMISQGMASLVERDKRTDVMIFQEFAEKEHMPCAKANKKSWRDDHYKLKTDMIPTFGKAEPKGVGDDVERGLTTAIVNG